jgi:cyanocobalamin reductase (cyanide-eliminating) / alkylcobalamin dealkylase
VVARIEDFAERCRAGGLDLVHAFGVDREPAPGSALRDLALPDFGRERLLGLLIGNTRALWPVFGRALHERAELRSVPDPLDRHVVDAVNEARAALSARSVVYFSHLAEPRVPPVQRIALEAGFAHLAPSHLSIHPEHGPWVALRAIVIVDLDGPAVSPRAPDPCTPCPKPCLIALERALTSAKDWRAWLAVRDACPVGRDSRYGETQLAYHYTKDRDLLARR